LTNGGAFANTTPVRCLKRVFSLLTLLCWLSAIGHVAAEHGGVADGAAQHALDRCADDNDAPAPGGGHHHHDLSAMNGGQGTNAKAHQAPAPVWVPLFDALAERLADLVRQDRASRARPAIEHAPRDERDSGWLLVCQTALPVRGPSLAV
jgi:hypothetical protein